MSRAAKDSDTMSASARNIYVHSSIPGLSKAIARVLPNANIEILKNLDGDNINKISSAVLVSDNDMVKPLLYSNQDKLPSFVQGTWAGVDKCLSLLDASKPQPTLKLARFAHPNFAQIMTEYLVAQIVNSERRLYEIRDNQRDGTNEWKESYPEWSNYRCLGDLTIGILGIGEMGKDAAKTFKFFGSRVLGFVRNLPSDDKICESVDEYFDNSRLGEMLKQCDYICSVLPKTPETTNILNGDNLSSCKDKSPVLINIGRSNIISEPMLMEAIDKGWLREAHLDVFDREPLPKDHPFWRQKKIFITPHVAGISRPADIALCLKNNIQRLENGEEPKNLVDWKNFY